MAYIILPNRWKNAPAYPVGLDLSSPFFPAGGNVYAASSALSGLVIGDPANPRSGALLQTQSPTIFGAGYKDPTTTSAVISTKQYTPPLNCTIWAVVNATSSTWKTGAAFNVYSIVGGFGQTDADSTTPSGGNAGMILGCFVNDFGNCPATVSLTYSDGTSEYVKSPTVSGGDTSVWFVGASYRDASRIEIYARNLLTGHSVSSSTAKTKSLKSVAQEFRIFSHKPNGANDNWTRANTSGSLVYVAWAPRFYELNQLREIGRNPFQIFAPIRRRIYFDVAAGGGAITGTCSLSFGEGSSTLTGSGALLGTAALTFSHGSSVLTGSGALLGSTDLVFTPAGTLTDLGSGEISGSAAITFTATGTLTGSGELLGSAAVTFTTAAALTGSGALAGTADMVLSATGTVVGSGALLGSSAIVITPVGTALGAGALVGSTNLVFTPSATLTGLAAGAISGTADMVFGAGASTLTGVGTLSGTADMVFTAVANVPTTGVRRGGGYYGWKKKREKDRERLLERIKEEEELRRLGLKTGTVEAPPRPSDAKTVDEVSAFIDYEELRNQVLDTLLKSSKLHTADQLTARELEEEEEMIVTLATVAIAEIVARYKRH